MVRPAGYENFSTSDNKIARQVFNGWNNLSEFEE